MNQTLEGYRLSRQQKYLWQLQQRLPQLAQAQCVVAIEGPVSESLLRESLERVVSRNQILRTRYERLSGMDVPLQVAGDERGAVRWNSMDQGDDGVVHAALERDEDEQFTLRISLSALSADAVTFAILVEEIAREYEALVSNVESDSEDDVLQYVKFSEWQLQLVDDEASAEEKRFWRSVLARGQVAPSLPFEKKPGSSESFAPSVISFQPGADTTAAIFSWAQALNASVASVVQACWHAWLSIITKQNEFCVHTLFDGRKYDELKNVAGLMTQYLPLYTQIEPEYTFAELVRMIEQTWQEALEWEEYFDAGELPQTAAVQFAFEQAPRPVIAAQLTFTIREQHIHGQPYKIKLSGIQHDEELSFKLHYDASIYDSAAIETFAKQLLALIDSAVSNPEANITFDLMTAAEKRRVLIDFNQTETAYASDRCVPQVFEQQVALTPDAVAVVYEDEQLTYGDLNARANQVAHYLRGLGAGPEVSVALYMNRSVEMIVGLFGILKSGAAYLPLDLNQPAPRLQYILEDAAAPIVLTQAGVNAGWVDTKVDVVRIDEVKIRTQSDANPAIQSSPDNLAYLIYTSGSAGQPKAVMVCHSSVLNLATGLRESVYVEQPAALRVSVNAPLAFDGSVKQWVQLLCGHTLDIVPEEIRPDGEQLLSYLDHHSVAVLDCTPAQLRLLLQSGLKAQKSLSLRLLLVGGEAFDEAAWTILSDSNSIACFNVYGPTECTVDATACRVEPSVASPAIGRPLANVQAYVLTEDLRPVPAGISGELRISGAGLARGYLNRPDLTAEKFTPHSYSSTPGARLYRTGDVARYLPDGKIEFLGRSDYQVKVRGYRVELGEIESALAQHPSVRTAVVTVRGDSDEGQPLIAYVVPERKRAATVHGQARYELPNGMAIAHQNKNETDYLYQEIFEKQIYVQHGIKLRDDACIFDVGANIGMFTLFVNQSCARPRIYAFEPLRPIFETLRVNAELYGDNVKLFNYGLSDTCRTESFTFYPRYSMMSGASAYANPESEIEVVKSFLHNEQRSGVQGMGSLLELADELLAERFSTETLEAQLKTLSDVIREEQIERIDLLKIDVQRAELDVLKGVDKADWARIEQIVMEVHDAEGEASAGRVREIETLLNTHGFTVWSEQDVLLQGTDRYNLYARKGADARNGHPTTSAVVALRTYAEPQMVTPAELRSFLRERLPEYMVPPVVMLMDSLPLTRNGKVDRAALPTRAEDSDSDHDLTHPSNVFEEVLANIWCDVLGVKRAGVEENFFDLGGHSLLATQLISRVRNVFHLEVPLRAIFEQPTIAGLAQTIANRVEAEHRTAYPPIEPAPRDGNLPLSFAQHRLWFLNQLEPDSPFYNLRHHLLLKGKLNVSALERTFTEIVRRHESLRTSFVEIDGNPVQVIADAQPLTLDVIDLSHLAADERGTTLRRIAENEVRQPFDLSQAPLMRVKLLRLGEEEHALLYTMHHLISDGWSSSVLLSEVVALYTAFINNEPSPLPDPRIQYADFAVWQRQCLEGAGLEVHLDYWRRQLADAPAELALPVTRTRARVQTFRSETLPLSFSASTTEALKALSRREGTTLFMTLLAAFQALLYRYTGQDDIIVGTPVANRNRQEVEHLIGFFVNTLVLCTNLKGNPSFIELMRRVRDVTLEAYAHQDLPFEKLVQEIQVRRDLSRTPLFQVLMIFQNVPRTAEGLPGLTATELITEDRWSNFDLTLWVTEVPQGLACTLEYNTDLFDAAPVQRMIEHFQLLVESAINDPSQPISSLQLSGSSERNRLLNEWNNTQSDYPSASSFIELFEAQAATTPDRVAVVDEHEQLTYAELNRRANRLAHKLIKAGVRSDGLVGLLSERNAGFLTAILGIFKAGGAYLPLDPRSPAARQRQVLEQSGVKWVLIEAGKQSLIEQTLALFSDCEPPQVLVLNDLLATDENAQNPGVQRSPSELVYVIYTSGSTGVPKGVMIEQRGMLNHLYAKIVDLQITESDVVAQTASQCFDISVWQYLAALLTGGRVAIFDDNIAMDGTRLLNAASSRGVTVLETVPSLLRVMLQTEEHAATENLKWLLLTGEALPPQICREWRKQYPDVRLLNAYGPTECSDDVTHYEIAEAPVEEVARTPIGKGVSNTQLYIVDRFQQLAPAGVFGELLVGGEGVGRGYLNDAGRTAEVFIPDGYGARSGARLYRTGDIVRWLDGGVLEYIGRVDHQVKVRGNRIELGEIEAALSKHSAVRDNVVETRTDEDGSRFVVAYVVLDDEVASDLNELRTYLQEQLPDYMVPSMFMPLSQLPLTANGKIDRRALPAPSRDTLVRVRDYVAPRDEVEAEVARIWSEVLGVEKAGVNDDFFELGGHSLLATQVVSRIRKSFQIEFPLRTLFEQTTIASLAAAIGQMQFEEEERADAELLVQLEQFSEEEVQAMLSGMLSDGVSQSQVQ
jgi:amino acid adenylation domain-containing protein/FkbM family methyltransferase